MTSGQDQDSGGVTGKSEEEGLIRDLRSLVHYGKELNGAHCQELAVLPGLIHFLTITRTYKYGTSSAQPGDLPYIVRISVELAIDKLTKSGDLPQSTALAAVRKALFGLSPETEQQGPTGRWRAALKIYNQRVNSRSLDATAENFRRRIYGVELLVSRN